MNKANLVGLIIIFSLLLSCKKEEVILKKTTNDEQVYENNSSKQNFKEFTLYAGQHIECGSIKVTNDNDFIYIKYNTTGGWNLKETHLYIGEKNQMPSNDKGNPKIGNFPHQNLHNQAQTFEYKVAKNNLDCLTIAAHASVELVESATVIQQETAWAKPPKLNGDAHFIISPFETETNNGSWFTTVDYCNQ